MEASSVQSRSRKILAVLLCLGGILLPALASTQDTAHTTGPRIQSRVRFLAVGDVNLGRAVGQELLKGDTLFPFRSVADTFATYDIVFGNLESALSDQKGQTQDPNHNLIFCGPPIGAMSLKQAGFTIVSLANNHMLDYGRGGLKETIASLEGAGIAFAGAGLDSALLYRPARMMVGGITFAFFACTSIMNSSGNRWKNYVASSDTSRLMPAIRHWRSLADVIIVSYHGGTEYADQPEAGTRGFARAALDAGADLVLGHHPHVPYGVETWHGKYLVPSLGNFVFRQPARYWTQRSYALACEIARDSSGVRIASLRCLPALAGGQPRFLSGGDEASRIRERVESLSTEAVVEKLAW